METKPVIFVGNSHSVIKNFPEIARKAVGRQLWLVQNGQNPNDWRPMPSVGLGVKEIRIHRPHEHRVIYITHFREAIYVLNAFEKKTQQTPKRHINLARAAYAKVKETRTINRETTYES